MSLSSEQITGEQSAEHGHWALSTAFLAFSFRRFDARWRVERFSRLCFPAVGWYQTILKISASARVVYIKIEIDPSKF
jgi:hypothetical protein